MPPLYFRAKTLVPNALAALPRTSQPVARRNNPYRICEIAKFAPRAPRRVCGELFGTPLREIPRRFASRSRIVSNFVAVKGTTGCLMVSYLRRATALLEFVEDAWRMEQRTDRLQVSCIVPVATKSSPCNCEIVCTLKYYIRGIDFTSIEIYVTEYH